MCIVLLPPGDNPIAVNKYTHIYIYISRTGHILNKRLKKESKISEDNSYLLEDKNMQEN
jgi:hypothetical protein